MNQVFKKRTHLLLETCLDQTNHKIQDKSWLHNSWQRFAPRGLELFSLFLSGACSVPSQTNDDTGN